MTVVLDSACLNVLPSSSFPHCCLSFLLGDHAQPCTSSLSLSFTATSVLLLAPLYMKNLVRIWAFLLRKVLYALSLPPSSFFPFPSAPLFMLIRSQELPLTKARRLTGQVRGLLSGGEGCTAHWRQARGLRAVSSDAFPGP